MDFQNKIFTVLLVVVTFAFSNLARTLNSNFALPDNDPICNDEKSLELIKTLRNVTQLESPPEKLLIVLTDSESNMYAPLKDEISKRNVVFMPLHVTLKNDIKNIYKNILFLGSASNIRFIIHAQSIEKVSDIFKEFIRIFKDPLDVCKSIGVALTLNQDVKKEKVVFKLIKAVENLNRSEIVQCVDKYLLNNGPPIAVFNNESANNPKVDTFVSNIFYSSVNKEYKYFKFVLDEHFQEQINCATSFMHKEVVSDVKRYVENRLKNYFDALKDPVKDNLSAEEKLKAHTQVAKSYNYLLHFSQTMSGQQDPKSFLKNFQDAFKDTVFEEHFEKTYFLPQYIDVIHFLCAISEDAFSSATEEWTKPLRDFTLQNPEKLSHWYQKEGEGFLFSRDLETNCIKMSRNKKLQVRAKVVRLSDIDIAQCTGSVRFIEIFAEEKVVINENLNLIGWEMQVAIIAPVWEVIGDRRIVLDGLEAKAPLVDRANNGDENGNKNGASGLAGLPGGPAGSFYGVADKIIHGDRLVISAVGGTGGKGQYGGHGAQGESGVALKDKDLLDCNSGTVNGPHEVSDVDFVINGGPAIPTYLVYGSEGKRGGRGGNGGVRGLGGLTGTVILLELSKNNSESQVSIETRKGNNGDTGYGGRGGLGGSYGNISDIYCSPSWNPLSTKFYPFLLMPYGSDNRRGPSGLGGEQGVSLKMRQMPKKALIVQNFPHTVNEYKMYIRPQLVAANNSKEQFVSFYESLNTRREIADRYNMLDIIDEFEGLEHQAFSTREKSKLNSSYVSLEARIANCEKKLNYEDEKLAEYKHVISKLKTDVSSKLKEMKKGKTYSVKAHVERRLNDIISWKPILEKQDRMNTYLTLFDKNIAPVNDLIEEANTLINDELKSRMRDIETTLDHEINSLLQEISELKKESVAKEDDLLESRQKLKQIMALKAVFGVMKVGCGLVGIVNPALGLAATVVSTTLTVIETQTTNYKLPETAAQLPKVAKALQTASENFLKKSKAKKEDVLEIQKQHLLDLKEKVSGFGKNLIDKIWNTIRRKKEKIESEPQLGKSEEIYEIEEAEVTEELQKAEKENNSEKINDCKIGINVVKYLKVANELLQTGSDTIANIMKDDAKVDEIDKALKENRENLKRLQTLEEDVYNSTQPMLNEMINFMDETEQNMSIMSENRLVIANWNVVNTIENVQRTLKKTLDGFDAADDINWTLKKLISTFDKIIKMHQKIEEYGRRKSESEFKTLFHIAEENGLLVSDNHLMKALARLSKSMMQNSARMEYEKWINAFKQFVFPYSGDIVKNTLWLDSSTYENIEHSIECMKNSINEFNKLSLKGNNFNQLLENRVRDDFLGSFGSEKKAFFVWSNEDSESAISDILSGKETKLLAHVRKTDLEVVKFNQVEILFSSKNAETQQNLNNALKDFTVTLTHHGDSIYKFNNKTFEIKTSPKVLKFRLPKTADTIPNQPSEEFISLANGKYILSPYATWTVKLKDESSKDFQALKTFMGKVDLELVGKGQFLKDYQCDRNCENDVLKCYKYLYRIV